jgi:hypothetical protein
MGCSLATDEFGFTRLSSVGSNEYLFRPSGAELEPGVCRRSQSSQAILLISAPLVLTPEQVEAECGADARVTEREHADWRAGVASSYTPDAARGAC